MDCAVCTMSTFASQQWWHLFLCGHLVGNIVSQSLPSEVLAIPVGDALCIPLYLPSQHVLGDGIPPQRSETQDCARYLSPKHSGIGDIYTVNTRTGSCPTSYGKDTAFTPMLYLPQPSLHALRPGNFWFAITRLH